MGPGPVGWDPGQWDPGQYARYCVLSVCGIAYLVSSLGGWPAPVPVSTGPHKLSQETTQGNKKEYNTTVARAI